MTKQSARREVIKASLAVAALGALPEWVIPALAQGQALVPFTDLPANANFAPAPDRRVVDIRRINGPFTPADQFYTIQHYNQPDFDPATYRLSVSGLVDRPISLSLDDLRKMRASELVAGFECSGNRRPLQGLCGNGRWSGVPLRAVLDRAGVKSDAREFVFFGADRGEEEVEFRAQKFKVEQQFGRSLSRDHALSGEPFLAYALNGEPLTKNQGAPLRLLVPGWYGVCNVKWLSQIHVQAEQYLGKFQARWYRTLKGETIDGETKWTETAISRMKLKSFIARVTRDGSGLKILGVVLNDGTPIRSVEVRVDDGPWQRAAMDGATSSKYSWKLFTYAWNGATPGEHTIVSRVTDMNGIVQPTTEALESKKTFLEDNSQFPRKVMIS
jgi:DMSO/TMAO reductase YedYZ molybdopterin-dependent catalytic subunit